MDAAARETLTSIVNKSILVTGGGGFVGNRIVLDLLRLHANKVVVIDLRAPPEEAIPQELRELYAQRVELKKIDLQNSEEVVKALEGIDLVVHTASFGMSGVDMLMKEKVRSINVGGTQTLLNGCSMQGVLGLVYTSSANVVFSGKKELADPGEDVPYNREEDCVDEYSKTKCIAEQLVVKFNGRPLKMKNAKHPEYTSVATCAVRPAAIYGEGEERHFPRIIEVLESGMLQFLVGSPDSLVDWVHVDNLVYGHILAAAKLLSPRAADRELVGGKAYYISDKKPMNNWIFMRPFFEGLGFKFPTIWIPFGVMFKIAHLLEIIHAITSPIFPHQPFANRAEVCKIGVTHYFRTDKAERELGWSRVVTPEEGMNRMVKYFQERQAKRKPKKEGNSKFILGVFALLFIAVVIAALFRVK